MASATPAQLRAAIGTYLASRVTYTDASGKTQQLQYLADGQSAVTPPTAVVLPANGQYLTYDTSMGAQNIAYSARLRILVLISKGDVKAETPLLDAFLSSHGASSIVQALLSDPTVGGVADFVIPTEATWSGNVEWAGQEYMAGQILLEAGAQ